MLDDPQRHHRQSAGPNFAVQSGQGRARPGPCQLALITWHRRQQCAPVSVAVALRATRRAGGRWGQLPRCARAPTCGRCLRRPLPAGAAYGARLGPRERAALLHQAGGRCTLRAPEREHNASEGESVSSSKSELLHGRLRPHDLGEAPWDIEPNLPIPSILKSIR